MLPEPLFLNIHMYGIMIAISILFAYFILFFLTKKKQIDGTIFYIVQEDIIKTDFFMISSAKFK